MKQIRQTVVHNGISYKKPVVQLLNYTPIGVAELAGRTAYQSFDKSEHEVIRNFDISRTDELDIDSSKLLDQLLNVYFHNSVAEHIVLQFKVITSRGVLQETSRHRFISPTVKSTRYVMNDVIYAFSASKHNIYSKRWFINKMISLDLLVTSDKEYNSIEWSTVYDKLQHQQNVEQDKFFNFLLSKENLHNMNNSYYDADECFEVLSKGKAKRNSGDTIKHIVTDNWETDMIWTVNIRALDNFLKLRDSDSAYFQIKWLAQEIKKQMPSHILDLISK